MLFDGTQSQQPPPPPGGYPTVGAQQPQNGMQYQQLGGSPAGDQQQPMMMMMAPQLQGSGSPVGSPIQQQQPMMMMVPMQPQQPGMQQQHQQPGSVMMAPGPMYNQTQLNAMMMAGSQQQPLMGGQAPEAAEAQPGPWKVTMRSSILSFVLVFLGIACLIAALILYEIPNTMPGPIICLVFGAFMTLFSFAQPAKIIWIECQSDQIKVGVLSISGILVGYHSFVTSQPANCVSFEVYSYITVSRSKNGATHTTNHSCTVLDNILLVHETGHGSTEASKLVPFLNRGPQMRHGKPNDSNVRGVCYFCQIGSACCNN